MAHSEDFTDYTNEKKSEIGIDHCKMMEMEEMEQEMEMDDLDLDIGGDDGDGDDCNDAAMEMENFDNDF